MAKIIQFPLNGSTQLEEDPVLADNYLKAGKSAHLGTRPTYRSITQPLVLAALLFGALHVGLYSYTKHKLSKIEQEDGKAAATKYTRFIQNDFKGPSLPGKIFLYSVEGGMKLAAGAYMKEQGER